MKKTNKTNQRNTHTSGTATEPGSCFGLTTEIRARNQRPSVPAGSRTSCPRSRARLRLKESPFGGSAETAPATQRLPRRGPSFSCAAASLPFRTAARGTPTRRRRRFLGPPAPVGPARPAGAPLPGEGREQASSAPRPPGQGPPDQGPTDPGLPGRARPAAASDEAAEPRQGLTQRRGTGARR